MLRYIAMGKDNKVAKMQCFLLPGSSDHLICFGTYCWLLGYGRGVASTVKRYTATNASPRHGLKSQLRIESNRFEKELKETLVEHFKRLVKKVLPKATQVVQIMGAVKMHDDNDDICKLPTSYSK